MNLRPPGYEPDELPTALSRDIGAGDRGRTGTGSLPRDFKSRASANSATPASRFVAPFLTGSCLLYHTCARSSRVFSCGRLFSEGNGKAPCKQDAFLVRQKGLEPPTYWFVASYSIQLSYCRMSLTLADDFIMLPHSPGKCKHYFLLFLFFCARGADGPLRREGPSSAQDRAGPPIALPSRPPCLSGARTVQALTASATADSSRPWSGRRRRSAPAPPGSGPAR